jgi:tetratricopeptide (TPR) repeat protein
MNRLFVKLIFVGFMLTGFDGYSQVALSVVDIDKVTYKQYVEKKWDELIKTGNNALKKNIDFYYLDIRMGVAYFEKKRYIKAISFLEKTLSKDNNNSLVNELLYYSYLYSGREMDASKLKKNMPYNVKKVLGMEMKNSTVEITFDFKLESFEDYYLNPDLGHLIEQTVVTGFNYFSFGLGNTFGSNNLYFNFGRINKSVDFYHVYEVGSNGKKFYQINSDGNINQNQLYIKYSNQINYGLNLTLAFNWINLSTTDNTFLTDITSNYVAGFIAIKKDIGNFKFSINTSVSNLESNLHIQPGTELLWYPFFNTNLYLYGKVSYNAGKTDESWNDDLVVTPGFGFRVLTVYLEPSFTIGNIKNYLELDAFIVNNDIDVIKNRLELFTYGYFFKGKLYLFFKYQNYTKTNKYKLDNNEGEINYKNNTYTCGIKFNF